jgi:hypothetical protein
LLAGSNRMRAVERVYDELLGLEVEREPARVPVAV